jgi:hypothetical protein
MNEQQLSALKLALGALEESVDLVQEDYENAKKLYGNYPTRQARLLGMEDGLKKHEEAITALQSIIEQPAPVQTESLADIGAAYEDIYAEQKEELAKALAQPAPAAAPVESPDDWSDWKVTPPIVATPLATQQKPWVDLTDEEIMAAPENLIACIAYVKNKLREKNT